MRDLAMLLWTYQQTLLALQDHPDDTELVVRLLLTRDDLALALAETASLHPRSFQYLATLDQKLRDQASRLVRSVGAATLNHWRQSRQPPATAWWWYLDQPPIGWQLVTAACLIGTLVLLVDFAIRFLRSGVDPMSLLQVILPLLAVGTFTRAGQQWITRLLTWLPISQKYHRHWRVGLAVGCLVFALILWWQVRPWIAQYYNNRGVTLHQSGAGQQVSAALKDYQRAISLAPTYAEASYNLATAYEDLHSYEQAIAAYQQAIEYNDQVIPLENNLARLYILSRADYAAALSLLNRAEQLLNTLDKTAPDSRAMAYSLYKNRGWAYLGLELYDHAEADLLRALDFADGGGASCLLAQVQEAQARDAQVAWQHCLARSHDPDVEDTWAAMAREHIPRP